MNKLLIVIIVIATLVRFIGLGANPPSLYWDEVGLGYNAYSILETGKDEHDRTLPLDYFLSFRDYKPPAYIYNTVPIIAIFGLNEWSVRFVSALAGVLATTLTYFFVLELLKNYHSKNRIRHVALLAAFLMAISPWSVQVSRVAYEANLGHLFTLLGAYLFIRWVNTHQWWWLLSSTFSFVITFYTFNSNRVFTPLLVGLLGLVYFKEWFPHSFKKALPVSISILLGIMLLLPLIGHVFSDQGQMRYKEVNIFSDLKPLTTAQQRIDRAGGSLLANIFNNRRVLYTQEWLHGYFSHFRGDFLFLKGDVNPRFSSNDVGQLYLVSLPFILLGLYVAATKFGKAGWVIIGWMLLAPVPAAFAREVPHALRTLHILPTFDILTAIGMVFLGLYLYRTYSKKYVYISIVVVSLTLCFQVFYFLYNYAKYYPAQTDSEWQYGYKQMVTELIKISANYDRILVTNALGRPYINILFYAKYSPEQFQKTRRYSYDDLGLFEVSGFDKYDFKPIDWVKDISNIPDNQKTLIVGVPSELKYGRWTKTYIKDLNGRPVFFLNEVPQGFENSTERGIFNNLTEYNTFHNTNYRLDEDNRWIEPNVWQAE